MDDAAQKIVEQMGRRVVVVVGHADFDTAAEALEMLVLKLEQAGVAQRQIYQSAEQLAALSRNLFDYRSGLLSRADRQRLLAGEPEALIQRAQAQLFSPMLAVGGGVIADDPLFLFPQFLADQAAMGVQKMSLRGGVLSRHVDGVHFVLVTMTVSGQPFDQGFQQRFVKQFDLARQLLTGSGLQVLATGAVFFAHQAVEQGRRDSLLIGAVSLVSIIGLLAGLFRSGRPLLLSLLSVTSGLIGGLAAAIMLFDEVHVIALVFGAAIIGISVDYAIHYFCEGLAATTQPPAEKLQRVLPGLTLGMVSSVIGFATLAQAPFPGLRQIAVFSGVGLVCAYLTVVLTYVTLDKSSAYPHSARLLLLAKTVEGQVRRLAAGNGSAVLLLLVVSGGVGLSQLVTADDDIRKLQVQSGELQTQEQLIRGLTGLDNATQFFLVSGANTEAVLQAEERLNAELDRLIEKKVITGYNSVASLVPSGRRQAQNRQLIMTEFAADPGAKFFQSLGLSPELSYGPGLAAPLTPQQLVTRTGAGPFLELLLIDSTDMVVNMVTLRGVGQLAPLEVIATGLDRVELVDQAARWSEVFATYRQRAINLLMIAIVLIWLFLSFRYGPLVAARVVAVPTAAIVLTPLITGVVLTEAFTFFSAMGLMLVFMIGLDYALFYVEASDEQRPVSFLANGLSALSTGLAFGLMTFSATYAVHAFGVTILTGITLAFLLSPLCAGRSR